MAYGVDAAFRYIHAEQLLGAFDHIYSDNYFGEDGVNTHYVVLTYNLKLQNDMKIAPDVQHSEIKWWTKHSLLNDPAVH